QKEDAPPRTTGRSVSEHPEEALLAKARAQQKTQEFKDTYPERQTVEHRLARMMQLGARQARYFGRAKSQLQWLLTATVANLTLANKTKNKKGDQGKDKNGLNGPLASFNLLYALYNQCQNGRRVPSKS